MQFFRGSKVGNHGDFATTATDNDKHLKDIVYKAPDSVDKLLSDELLQLSLKDRNVIDEEIHGVTTLAPAQIECPAFLEKSLQELSIELTLIPDETPFKAAYLKSQTHPVTYVNTPDFRLRFLRYDLFDAQKAAVRICKFLDFALHLFGPQVLQRPPKLCDFTRDEKKYMQYIQPLPYADQKGRPILAFVGEFRLKKETVVTHWKCILYIVYTMADDIESQRKGFISLIFIGSDQMSVFDWIHFSYTQRSNDGSPLRQCSLHFCMPDLPPFHPIHIMRAGLALALEDLKSRLKIHVGNQVENMYKLKSYGIPVEYIPVTETGGAKTTYLKKWMKAIHYVEEERERGSPDARFLVIMPRASDVIFRSGIPLNSHPGNSAFETIIGAKVQEHVAATQTEKETIVKTIIEEIREQGGRFLQWEKGGWWKIVQDDSQIHYKVAWKMRRITAKLTAEQQRSKSSTSAFSNQDNAKRRKLTSSGDYSSDSSADGCFKNSCNCFGQTFHSVS